MRILKTFGEGAGVAEAAILQLEARGAVSTAKVDGVVREILEAVAARGDAAVRELSAKFDGLTEEQPLQVSREEMQAAWEATSEELKAAMRLAQANIRAFAEKQLPRAFSFRPSEGNGGGADCAGAQQRGVAMCRVGGIRCLRRC